MDICGGDERAAWVYAAYEFAARLNGVGDTEFLALSELQIQELLLVRRDLQTIREGRRTLIQTGILEERAGHPKARLCRIDWRVVRHQLSNGDKPEAQSGKLPFEERENSRSQSGNSPSPYIGSNECLNEYNNVLPPAAMPQGKEEAKLLELLGTTVLEGRTVSGDDVSKMGAMLRTYPLRAQVKTLRKLETALRVGRPRTWYLVLAIIQDDGAAFAGAERNRRERPPQPHRRAVPEREPEPVMSAEELAWNEARNAEVRILLRLRAEGKRAEGDAKEREIVARFGPSFAQRPQARAAGA
jgi:hypothetical protein